MINPKSTPHQALRSGRGPWLSGLARPTGAPLPADRRCDVAIIGAGITGAIMAEHLSARGLQVVVIDRETEGFGSTAASTAMLQWEIDQPLRRLTEIYGFDKAAEVYRRSVQAVSGLQALAGSLGVDCGFIPRDTVYLAAGDIGFRELSEEFALRQRAGLPGALLDHPALLGHFGFDRAGAIVSPGSAEADPLSLCHALLHRAVRQGALLIRDEATDFDATARGAAVVLAGGHVVEAEHIVLATGYVMPEGLRSDLHRVASSWAIATEPQPREALWPGPALVWEASEDYVYCRTTTDGRIVIGGEDEDQDDPDLRARLVDAKAAILLDKLAALRPGAQRTLSHAWAGAFGQTSDGLPLIGRVPGQPRILAAYGYGGNGITFSFLASRLIGALIAGHEEDWFRHFAIDRADPS